MVGRNGSRHHSHFHSNIAKKQVGGLLYYPHFASLVPGLSMHADPEHLDAMHLHLCELVLAVGAVDRTTKEVHFENASLILLEIPSVVLAARRQEPGSALTSPLVTHVTSPPNFDYPFIVLHMIDMVKSHFCYTLTAPYSVLVRTIIIIFIMEQLLDQNHCCFDKSLSIAQQPLITRPSSFLLANADFFICTLHHSHLCHLCPSLLPFLCSRPCRQLGSVVQSRGPFPSQC